MHVAEKKMAHSIGLAQSKAPSCPRSRGIEFPAMKYKRQKEEAIARLQEQNIPQILQELLNKACKLNPDDLFGYMAEHFHSLSKEPVISSLSAWEGLDSNSRKSVEVDLYCTVCAVEKLVSRTSLSVDPYITVPGSVVSTPRKGSGKKHKGGSSRGNSPANSNSRLADAVPALGLPVEKKVNCVDTVKVEISKALKGLSVRKQRDVDQVLDTLRIKAAADKVILEPSSLLAVSCAVALAGSELSSHPLFLYLSPFRVPQSVPPSPTSQATRRSLKVAVFPEDVENMKTETSGPDHSGKHVRSRSGGLSLPIPPPPSHPPQQYSMPFLVTAMLGQSTGKLKVREFCVCPLPNSAVPQQIKMLERLHYELGKVLAAKLGAGSRVTFPNGAYAPALDKLDQGIDLIKEATVSSGFQFNVDVAVLIDVGADVLYDEDKAKYEIMTGHWKTADELINMYSDLVLHSNGGVLGFIDPLHPKDVAGWKKLMEKLGSKCLVVADSALQKGLPVVVQSKEQAGSGRPSVQGVDGNIKVEGEDGSKVDAEGEDVGNRVDRLSCVAMTWNNSLSSTMDKIDHFKGCCLYIMLTAPPNLTVNAVLADLAVASRCKFFRLGAPTGMVNLLLNRLLRIHEELVSRRLLETTQSISFYTSDSQL